MQRDAYIFCALLTTALITSIQTPALGDEQVNALMVTPRSSPEDLLLEPTSENHPNAFDFITIQDAHGAWIDHAPESTDFLGLLPSGDIAYQFIRNCVESYRDQDLINTSLTEYLRDQQDKLLEEPTDLSNETDLVDEEAKEAVTSCVTQYMENIDSAQTAGNCSGCSKGDVPGPYFAEQLSLRWYQPFLDPELPLSRDQYPLIHSTMRKKTLIVVHGWLGWGPKTYRQKMRFFHNAKEDVLYGGPVLMGPMGLDLTFTFVTGNPNSDDLGAMLQCAPDPNSTVSKGETSLVDFLQTSGRGGCNLKDSYNVGYLNWAWAAHNQSVKDTEKSLWVKTHPKYIKDETLLTLLKNLASDLDPNSEVIFVGHSLGAGLAIRLQNVLMKAIQAGDLPSTLQGSRLVLADPYFSNFGLLPYDSRYWPGRRARGVLSESQTITEELRRQKEWSGTDEWSQDPGDYFSLNIVSTRDDQTEFFGDENRPLKYDHNGSIYVDLRVNSIRQGMAFTRSNFPKLFFFFHILDNAIYSEVSKNHRKHVYPLFWILDRLARGAAYNQTESLRILHSAQGGGWYKQTEGQNTINTLDDKTSFQVHLKSPD